MIRLRTGENAIVSHPVGEMLVVAVDNGISRETRVIGQGDVECVKEYWDCWKQAGGVSYELPDGRSYDPSEKRENVG